jgi:hypothetical protein
MDGIASVDQVPRAKFFQRVVVFVIHGTWYVLCTSGSGERSVALVMGLSYGSGTSG